MCDPCSPGGPCGPCSPCASFEPKTCSSRELRSGIMYTTCDCVKRNGLQDKCPRSMCQGRSACMCFPTPTCCPASFPLRYANMTVGVRKRNNCGGGASDAGGGSGGVTTGARCGPSNPPLGAPAPIPISPSPKCCPPLPEAGIPDPTVWNMNNTPPTYPYCCDQEEYEDFERALNPFVDRDRQKASKFTHPALMKSNGGMNCGMGCGVDYGMNNGMNNGGMNSGMNCNGGGGGMMQPSASNDCCSSNDCHHQQMQSDSNSIPQYARTGYKLDLSTGQNRFQLPCGTFCTVDDAMICVPKSSGNSSCGECPLGCWPVMPCLRTQPNESCCQMDQRSLGSQPYQLTSEPQQQPSQSCCMACAPFCPQCSNSGRPLLSQDNSTEMMGSNEWRPNDQQMGSEGCINNNSSNNCTSSNCNNNNNSDDKLLGKLRIEVCKVECNDDSHDNEYPRRRSRACDTECKSRCDCRMSSLNRPLCRQPCEEYNGGENSYPIQPPEDDAFRGKCGEPQQQQQQQRCSVSFADENKEFGGDPLSE